MQDEPLKITKRMKEFLQWMNEQGTVRLFPIEWCAIRKKAQKAGFIEDAAMYCDHRGGPFVPYQLSQKGKDALL